MQIVDARHSLWSSLDNRPMRLESEERSMRDQAGLERGCYAWSDYRGDGSAFEVKATVQVEAGFDHSNPAREAKFVSEAAKREGFPDAIVADMPLDRVFKFHMQLCGDYLEAVSEFSMTAKQILFTGTAERIYRPEISVHAATSGFVQ